MTIALRRQLQQHTFPNVSFGPFRFLEAMPWLVLAASMRVIAFNSPLIEIPATVFASIAVLHAFLVVTQRSIELAQGQTNLGALDFTEQSRLTRAILWRVGLLMLAVSLGSDDHQQGQRCDDRAPELADIRELIERHSVESAHHVERQRPVTGRLNAK